MGDRAVLARFSERGWQAACRRVRQDTFRTVPFYRERWALVGTGPVAAAVLQERRRDLVPLGGGALGVDGWAGFASTARMIGRRRLGMLLAVVTDLPPTLAGTAPPRGVRLRCLPPAARVPNPFDTRFTTVDELGALVARGRRCAVLGPPAELVALAARTGLFGRSDVEGVGPGRSAQADSQRRITPLPVHSPREGLPAAAGPGAVLHDGLLGYLAVVGECGRWHLDWRRVYAADTEDGVAFTVLRQRSPRLVDVLAGPGLQLGRCPRHRTPVLVRRGDVTAPALER